MNLNVVDNGQGAVEVCVLQARASCDHGPDPIPAGAMATGGGDALLLGCSKPCPLTGRALDPEAEVEGPIVGLPVHASLGELRGDAANPHHLCGVQPEGFSLCSDGRCSGNREARALCPLE